MRIDIAYNPYLVKTSISIAGTKVSKDSKDYRPIYRYIEENSPLQNWLEPIPSSGSDNWPGLATKIMEKCGNSEPYEVYFTGRKIDFEDLKMSFEQQLGDHVELSFYPTFSMDDQKSAQEIEDAVGLILKENFKKIVEDPGLHISTDVREQYKRLKENYSLTREKEFRIVFAGTYSSGKSTLINALIGKELLSSANGTCTSKVYRIYHQQLSDGIADMACIDKDGREIVPCQVYKTEDELLNQFSRIFPTSEEGKRPEPAKEYAGITEVILHTDLSHLYPEYFDQNSFHLCLVDTPGTDSEYGGEADLNAAISEINSDERSMIILINDGTGYQKPGFRTLLQEIEKDVQVDSGRYNQRFLFLLNKCDLINFGKNETLGQTITQFSKSLQDTLEHTMPRIFTTAALPALCTKKKLSNQKLSEAEKKAYNSARSCYFACDDDDSDWEPTQNDNYYFDQHCVVSAHTKYVLECQLKKLENMGNKEKIPNTILFRSGVPSLEASIKEYIARYAYPLKVRALWESFQSILANTEYMTSELSKKLSELQKRKAAEEQRKNAKGSEREAVAKRKSTMAHVHQTLEEQKQKINAISMDDILETIEAAKASANKSLSDLQSSSWSKKYKSKEDAEKALNNLAQQSNQVIESFNWKLNNIQADVLTHIRKICGAVDETLSEINLTSGFDYSDIGRVIGVGSIDFRAFIQEIRSNQENVTISNPEKARRYKWYEIPQKIHQVFAPDTIQYQVTEYALPKDKINKQLSSIGDTFENACDSLQSGAKEQMSVAKDRVSKLLDKIGAKLKQLQENSQKIEADMDILSRNTVELAKTEQKLKEYNAIITAVQKKLSVFTTK